MRVAGRNQPGSATASAELCGQRLGPLGRLRLARHVLPVHAVTGDQPREPVVGLRMAEVPTLAEIAPDRAEPPGLDRGLDALGCDGQSEGASERHERGQDGLIDRVRGVGRTEPLRPDSRSSPLANP